ncbi:unnamed protein product, partial [Didymodactylos carnosus]
CFTTEQLLQQTWVSTYLQIHATYKVIWNELPLLVFGSPNTDRLFKPFTIALVSYDKNAKCHNQLYNLTD